MSNHIVRVHGNNSRRIKKEHNERYDWCLANFGEFGGTWRITKRHNDQIDDFVFEADEDAMAFKLRWV